ncbi:hypothetical protein V6N12_024450 [Hibiscus sabdariffa]
MHSALWAAPPQGCFKINTDGARSVVDGRASCGVLCVTQMEDGCAWARGLCWVFVETDCLEACRILQGRPHAPDISNLTKHIFEICNREWMVSFHHVPRSGNKVVDFLAKQVNGENFDIQLFENPSNPVFQLLQADDCYSC